MSVTFRTTIDNTLVISRKIWEITGDFDDDFIAGFLYGGLYGTFAANPRLKMEIEFERYQYFFEVRLFGTWRTFDVGDREALIRTFPRTFSTTLEDIATIALQPFDVYEHQHVYRFWLRDMIVDTKAIRVTTTNGAEFLQGLFTALTAWNIPFATVLLSHLYYDGQWYRY